MEAPFRSLIPTPLSGKSFLRASHFQLGFDRRPQGNTVVSPYRTDYPPRWGVYQQNLILPPKCAGVLNQDMDRPQNTQSETQAAFHAWPVCPRPEICPPVSHLQMHADPHNRVFTSTARESYLCPFTMPRVQPSRVDKWDDSFPSGDKGKVPLPPSLYQQSYPIHQEQPPADKAPSQHLGNDNVHKGDGCTYYGSCYQTQYTGAWAPPAQRCNEDTVAIVFGDPRYHKAVSEQKQAYTLKHPESLCLYDPERAAAQTHRTNIQPGDGHHRFSTITSESYPLRKTGPTCIPHPHKNASSILRGDQSERNKENVMSTHQLDYKEPATQDLESEPACDHLKGQATLRLGDRRLASFSTTQQSDYRLPTDTDRMDPPKRSLTEHNIIFNCPDTGAPATTTQDMLVHHHQQKQRVTEEVLQKIKHSHLVHPWKTLRWFSTEQKDAYPVKYGGPISLAEGDFQLSSVPLGTMRKYQHQRKMTPADT